MSERIERIGADWAATNWRAHLSAPMACSWIGLMYRRESTAGVRTLSAS